jgi:hypothetical protein
MGAYVEVWMSRVKVNELLLLCKRPPYGSKLFGEQNYFWIDVQGLNLARFTPRDRTPTLPTE